ncbi:MAG: hypothetical protein Q4D04_15055 [Clostridia bacterium]|nr:hypothetical protein [Clostridia bacterium]
MTLFARGLICAVCGLLGTFLVLILVYLTIAILKSFNKEKQ